MSELLYHYAKRPLTKPITGRKQEKLRDVGPYTKPNGFWVSCPGEETYGWEEWCRAEEYRNMGTHKHRVQLAEDAKILRVACSEELDYFSELYAVQEISLPNVLPGFAKNEWKQYHINWKSVSASYDGIIISPYIWDRRLSLDGMDRKNDWYYTWDCASGCIWRKRAIKSVEYVEEVSPVE